MSSSTGGSSSPQMLPPTRGASSSHQPTQWGPKVTASPRHGRLNRIQLIASGVIAISALTGMLTWATTSIAPAPHVSVTLAGCDYAENLNLAPNGCGDRAVGQLASWVTGRNAGPRRDVRLHNRPSILSTRNDFAQLSGDPNAAVAIIYVSAHGISTPTGPGLLAADATQVADAYPLRDLLQKIATFPENQQKVLLLDCVHFLAQPSLGLVLNDFSRQVSELDSEIKAIPNFVLLLSTDLHQISCINPASGVTCWSAAILEGLNGFSTDLNHDGWVDLLEVHEHAAKKTFLWTNEFSDQTQSPCLLPLGEEGIRRSRNLALFPTNISPVEIPITDFQPRAAQIDSWWQQFSEMESRALHPCITSPILWRQFEATLLRYEHLELVRCKSAADALHGRLQELAALLGRTTAIESLACVSGVLPPSAAGFHAADTIEEHAQELARLLVEMPLDEAADHWLEVSATLPNAASISHLRRQLITEQVGRLVQDLRDQNQVDRNRLARIADMITAISDPLQPTPQLGLVLQLFSRDLPNEPLDSLDATRIARFLELSIRADQVTSTHPWWTPTLYSWLCDEVATADIQRRIAGDLLMGSADARQRAESYLLAAEQGYALVDSLAASLASAASTSALGEYQLTRIGKLLAARSTSSVGLDAHKEAERFQKLYVELDRMEEILRKSPPSDAAQRNALLSELKVLQSQFSESLAEFKQELDRWQQDAFTLGSAKLPSILAALQISGGSGAQRQAAWNRICRFTESPLEHTYGSRSLPIASEAKSIPANPWVKAGAELRGRLALAAWPAPLFNDLGTLASPSCDPLETHAQVARRLEVFASESNWWKSLQNVSHQLALREIAASERINAASSPAPTNNAGQLDQQVLLAKRMQTIPPSKAVQQVTLQRSSLFADYLAWQAQRFMDDGYWSLEAEGIPHFVRIANLLASDIATLSPQRPSLPLELTANPEATAEIVTDKSLVWTTQQLEKLKVSVASNKGALAEKPAFATLWVEAQGELSVDQPLAGQRVCRPLADPTENTDPLKPADTDCMLVHLTRNPEETESPDLLTIHGYFRGRLLRQPIDVRISTIPSVRITNAPLADGGRIAIQNSQTSDLPAASAVSFVIDCSGSMGAERGEPFHAGTKYAQAVTAIDTLLKSLPSGVQVSIWAFGQATGPEKTANPPERSVRRIQSPIFWEPQDTRLHQAILDAISYPNLEPWNQSPLFAAMFAAATDLREVDGVKSLVIITDGADNRIATDSALNPLGLEPQKLLEQHFQGTGITINIVGFRVDPQEQKATRQQLSIVERFLPPGRFVQVDQTDSLAQSLTNMLKVQPSLSIRLANPTNDPNLTASETIQLPLSPRGNSLNWTPSLKAGLYQVSGTAMTDNSLVTLTHGDQLVLSRTPTGELQPWSLIDHQYRWSTKRQAGRWNLALAPDGSSAALEFRSTLLIESQTSGSILSLDRPGEVWIEATDGERSLPISWQRNNEVPGVALDLIIDAPTDTTPSVQLWLSERPASAPGVLNRGNDFVHLEDLAPATWQLSEGPIHLTSAQIETHHVLDTTGRLIPQPCLVLRATFPPQRPIRLRTVGVSFAGQDEQCFNDVGHYTLRQWPVDRATVERSLKAIELISMEQFKLDVERLGGKTVFDSPATLRTTFPTTQQNNRSGQRPDSVHPLHRSLPGPQAALPGSVR